MPAPDARINLDRLWSTLEASAKIGPGRAGGLRRLTLTDEDKEMRDLFASWCQGASLDVTIDELGNMFARRLGRDNELPPVVTGSHLDTQVAGGRYDGILGVLAGLEIVRTLNDLEIKTKRPIEIINWTNEEGARFQPPMMCSGAFSGVYEADWIRSREDDDGITFSDALARIGYDGDVQVNQHALDSLFELHIEQGPILDCEGIQVGIVVGGYKTFGMHIDVHGETAHAGPTSMDKRRDALAGAAHVISAVHDIGWKYHQTNGKTTSPRLIAWPNKPGILAEYAQFSVDCRHPDPATAEQMLAEIEEAMAKASEKADVDMKIIQRWEFGNERFDPALIGHVRDAVAALGVTSRDLLSQAGHDAYNIAKKYPTAMIFSPCKDGITHNEAEHVAPSDIEPGANVLLHAMLARANA